MLKGSALICIFVGFIPAAPVCMTCHPKETGAFLKSPMGNSIAAPALIPGGAIGTVITIEQRDGRMVHSLAADGLTAEHVIAYQIGAAKIGRTYIVRIGSYLFESPASWYRAHGWGLSPGFETAPRVGFDRLIDAACLFCHADAPKFLDSDGRRFSGVTPAPISCERCHGPTADHVRRPTARNIINPSKLPVRARDSICEQCHLEGETRILNPGKSWDDFRPGDEFERTAATYLLTGQHRNARAVAQVEQLALSKCVRQSGGKLWCATCHSPHKPALDRNREIRAVCLSCHPNLSRAAHPAAQIECVSCHMPRLAPEDIPHSASTDHRILRRPESPANIQDVEVLKPWKEPPPAVRERDQALGEIVVGFKEGLPPLQESGIRLLDQLSAAQLQNDPVALSALVAINLRRQRPQQALTMARLGIEKQPDSGRAALNLALALEQTGDSDGAERELLHATNIDPSLELAWINLAKLYQKQGRRSGMIALIDHYLEWNPQSIMFRRQKAMLSHE
jgi:hypothetical protein